MASRQLPYEVTRESLLGLRASLTELPANAAAAEEWVKSFSDVLNMVASFGANAGINAYVDPPVVMLLEDVRGRLLQYATVAWIEHSPRVVAGIEERLHRDQIASAATRALSTPPAPTTETGPSARPSASDFMLLGEYARRVKKGSMTEAEFDKHCDSVLTAAASVTTILGRSVPSSSPAVVANPLEVTVRPAPKPVRQAAVTAAAGLVEIAPACRASLKRAGPVELMNPRTIPNYVRCDYCTRSKLGCAPRVSASPPYVCSRCEDADRPCIRQAYVRRRRKVQSSGTAASRLRRVAPPPPPSVPALGASSLLMGGGVSLSQVETAVSVIVWRGEVARAKAARELVERQEQFAQERYAEALGRVVAPVATTVDDPQSKRARTVLGSPGKGKGKGKGKACSEVVEEYNDEEDELADAGESEVDKVES